MCRLSPAPTCLSSLFMPLLPFPWPSLCSRSDSPTCLSLCSSPHSVKIGSLDPLAGREFDTVACLNVLDRCSHPKGLLKTMRSLMKPSTGKLLLAVVFPFRPFVEVGWGGKLVKPEEDLGMDPEAGWESSVNQMVEQVLQPAGFEVRWPQTSPRLVHCCCQ